MKTLKTKEVLPRIFPQVGDSLLVNRASESVVRDVPMHEISKATVLPTHHGSITTIDAVFLDGSVRTASGDIWRVLTKSKDSKAKFVAVA